MTDFDDGELVAGGTEADAVARLARNPYVAPVEFEGRYGVALPPGWTFDTYDEERDLDRPRRPSGVVAVYDAASFVAAVERRTLSTVRSPVVYVDEDTLALVAVLNDDAADEAGWRDYRVSLALRPTPEWTHWAKLDGKLVDQETFAEHVEDGVNELREPSPAIMLEVAQSIHGAVSAQIKSAHRLASGMVQFRYEEEGSASAGSDGSLAIPESLVLAVRPFVGSPAYEVSARFRYRLPRGGSAQLGYKLDRPHEVKRAAFRDVVEAVRSALDESALLLAGPAPVEV